MGTVTAERDALIAVFERYCRFGDTSGEKMMGITSRNFAKLFRDCGLLDKKLTLTHLDLAFTKATRAPSGATASALDASWGGKRLTYSQFLLALQLSAEYKGVPPAHLHSSIASQDKVGPVLNGTVPAFERFHDDTSTFTVLKRGDSKSKLIEKHEKVKLLPTAQMPTENTAVFALFEQYAMFGETVGTSVLGLTSRNFQKLFRDLELIDSKVTPTFLDLTFTKAARAPAGNRHSQPADGGGKRINYAQFLIACEHVAQARGTSLEALYKTLGGKEDKRPIVTATAAPANRFFDDRSNWTAVARNEASDAIAARRHSSSAAIVHAVRTMSLERAAEQNVHLAAAQHAVEREPPTTLSHELVTSRTLPVPREPVNRPALMRIFEAYARFGDNLGGLGAPAMTSRNFQKLMKDCAIVDRKVTPVFLDLVFTKSSRAPEVSAVGSVESSWGGRRISFHQFLVACELIAKARGHGAGELHSLLLVRCDEAPTLQGKAEEPNRLQDDKQSKLWAALANHYVPEAEY